ncbi:MAG: glycosyltransferase [Acidobacteriota bacterium]
MSSRVAFLMSGLGVVERGAEAFVVELAGALVERGFEVTTLGRGERPAMHPAVKHRRVSALRRDHPLMRAVYRLKLCRKVLDTLWLDPLSVEWATASLAALPHLWRARYDLLVMEGGLMGARLARALRRFRGTPFVDIAHGNSPKWERAFARQGPNRVVAFTEAAERMIADAAPKARIEVIPHGVDLAAFRPGLDSVDTGLGRPVVMTAGAVDSHKRIDRTRAAVRELHRRGKPASLLVLGDGPEAPALDEAAHSLGPTRYLRRTVPRDEMPRWYAAADVLTLPSISESFGLAYLEAMASGLPCVAPDDAVRREVIGEAGRFADPEDTAAYADALAEALEHDWQGLPRRRAEGFSAEATADAYARLFKQIIDETRRKG